jgi:plasmid stability protein
MKTTLNIDDGVVRQLKVAAGQSGRTMSELVEAALRQFLRHRGKPQRAPRLPTFNGGKCRVDISDHDALVHVMEKT